VGKEAIAAGITEIILVTRSCKGAVENHFYAHYELSHRLHKKGKEAFLETLKNILLESVTRTTTRQNDALGLGHTVLCAKHLLNNEPLPLYCPMVWCVIKNRETKNYSFAAMVNAWTVTGLGQVMV